MTSKFGEEYDLIHEEVINMHWAWRNFRHLFLDSADDTNLFRELAQGFSILSEFVLGNAVVLLICRLTDPAETGKYANLSFDRLRDVLAAKIEAESDPPETTPADAANARATKLAWMNSKVDEIKSKIGPIKPYRDKFLAHFDLETSLQKKTLLPKDVLNIITDILKSIRELMNGISNWDMPGEFGYEDAISKGDADRLLGYLRLAHDVWQARDDYHQSKIDEKQAINFLLHRVPYKVHIN